MHPQQIRKFCKPNEKAALLLKRAIEELGFSARAYDKVLRVARTIADLESEENILAPHIAEAIQYRSLDREFSIKRLPGPIRNTQNPLLAICNGHLIAKRAIDPGQLAVGLNKIWFR